MSGYTVALRAVVVVLLVAVMWRLWILARNVRKAEETAATLRSGGDSVDRVPAATVYSVDLYTPTLSTRVLVKAADADDDDPGLYATAVFLRDSMSASQLASDVAVGSVKVAYIASAAFRLMRADDLKPVNVPEFAKMKPPSGATLLWGVSAPEALPIHAAAAVDVRPPKGADGYVKAFVVGF